MSDYIVTFDQNGSPTIVHSFKYFQKIKNGLKTRYFYSKAEWDAYQRNLSGGTRSTDKVQTRTNPSPSNRPAGHAKNKTGEAKPGSVYKRGEGLNSSTPVTGSTGYVTKTKKEKEYAEQSQRDSTPWAKKYMTSPCPYCGHYKVRPANWEDKKLSVAFWGIFTPKLSKRFICEHCKQTW